MFKTLIGLNVRPSNLLLHIIYFFGDFLVTLLGYLHKEKNAISKWVVTCRFYCDQQFSIIIKCISFNKNYSWPLGWQGNGNHYPRYNMEKTHANHITLSTQTQRWASLTVLAFDWKDTYYTLLSTFIEHSVILILPRKNMQIGNM